MSKITKTIAALGVVAGLGIAALPLGSYAAEQDVAVSFTINPTVGSDATVCTQAEAVAINAGATQTVNCAISFSSNSPASVSIVDKDANTNLVDGSNTIAAFSTPQSTLTGEGWGYQFNATSGITATTGMNQYNGVPAAGSATTVATSSAAVSNAAGTFVFGVSTTEATLAGTYSDTVTIAITAN